MPTNLIFYGPPGTGKTYFLQSMMSDYVDYNISDQQIKNSYFHDTYDWLLVAMILLQNHGKMTPSAIQAKATSLRLDRTVNTTVILQKHSVDEDPMGLPQEKPRIFYKPTENEWYVNMIRLQEYEPQFFTDRLKESTVDRRYAFVTFHQSFSYEDFVEGIRPTYVEATQSIDYSPKPGVLREICQKANDHPEKQYALFIDEINRGNTAEIFGELISLIEMDKRQGMANELSVSLPYSKETFSVPNNLSFFGTMNSADKSIEAIDIALRRRFKFIPMVPMSNVIEKEMKLNSLDPNNIGGIDLIRLFETINARIELLLDRNHLLGHAMFVPVRTADDIVTVIREKVIPLLEEYFFDDLQKIQLVMNDLDEDGEIKPDAVYTHDTLSASSYFSFMGEYLLEDKKHYHIAKELTPNSLKHIYNGGA